MKKLGNKKRIVISTAMMLLLITVAIYFYIENPEEQLEKKYKGNKDYVLIKETKTQNYRAFLGKDDKNLYLDIFNKNNYQGGGEIKLADYNSEDNINIYNVVQEDSLVVIYGDNTMSKFKEYNLSIKGEGLEEKIIKKDIINEDYILDIYVFEKGYNNYPNLEFKKD